MSTVTPQPTAAPERLQPLNPDEEAVVRSLNRLIYAMPRAMDAEMVREQRLPLIDYLALMYLSEAPGRQLRISELATDCQMSLSGISRLVHKLESQGFVQRIRSEQDARGWHAVLTDAGFARLNEAWPAHLAAVRRHFLDHLAGLDLNALGTALQNVGT